MTGCGKFSASIPVSTIIHQEANILCKSYFDMKKTSQNVKAIIFDLGGVLIALNYNRALNRLVEITSLTENEIFSRMWGADLARKYESGMISTEKFLKQAASLLDMDHPGSSNQELREIFIDIFDEALVDVSTLEKLKKKYNLYLLSNTNPLHFKYVKQKYNFAPYFDEFFLSYQLGCMKPDPKIYKKVIDLTGYKPYQLIFIDDHAKNVRAAESAGITSFVFEGKEELVRKFKQVGIL